MSPNSKSILIAVVSFTIGLVVISIISNLVFKLNPSTTTWISCIVAVLIFTPVRTVIEKDTGVEYHLKWRFSSRVLIFK